MSALNVQVGGGHYKKYKIQPIEMLDCLMLPFSLANAIKYMRYADKNGIEDLHKAYHCVLLYLAHPHGRVRRFLARVVFRLNRNKFEQFCAQFDTLESCFIETAVLNYLYADSFSMALFELKLLYLRNGGDLSDLEALHEQKTSTEGK